VVRESILCSSCLKFSCPAVVGRHVGVSLLRNETLRDRNSLGEERLSKRLHAPDRVVVDYQLELVEAFGQNQKKRKKDGRVLGENYLRSFCSQECESSKSEQSIA